MNDQASLWTIVVACAIISALQRLLPLAMVSLTRWAIPRGLELYIEYFTIALNASILSLYTLTPLVTAVQNGRDSRVEVARLAVVASAIFAAQYWRHTWLLLLIGLAGFALYYKLSIP